MFKKAAVLDVFRQLPKVEQTRFLFWIGATDDRELRIKRTETFVSALNASPLG